MQDRIQKMDRPSTFTNILLLVCIGSTTVAHAIDNGSGASPCSPMNLMMGKLYHSHPANAALYIQCDMWGKSYLRHCPPGQVWDSAYLTCQQAGSSAKQDNNWQEDPDRNEHLEQEESHKTDLSSTDRTREISKRSMQPWFYYLLRNLNKHGLTNMGTDKSHQSWVKMETHNEQSTNQEPNDNGFDSKNFRDMSDRNNVENGHQSNGVLNGACPKRYTAVENNPSIYIECTDGKSEVQRCPEGNVWIQPLRKCLEVSKLHEIGVEQNGEKENLTTATPALEDGSQNPCVGSDQRYHPYPHDPSKYIECVSWNSVYVWNCGNEGLWVQPLQACLHVTSRTPSEGAKLPVTTTTTQQPDVTGEIVNNTQMRPWYSENPCNQAPHYHHSYPWDQTKFIQCDEYGNMYIRKCGNKKIWNNAFQTCVKYSTSSNEPASVTGSPEDESFPNWCPTGFTVNQATGMCTENNSFESSQNDNHMPTECAEGYYYDMVRDECLSLPNNDLTDVMNNGNEMPTDCPEGYYYDIMKDECLNLPNSDLIDIMKNGNGMSPNCPNGFYFDMLQDKCLRLPENDPSDFFDESEQEEESILPLCDHGQFWHPTLKMCLAISGLEELYGINGDNHANIGPRNGAEEVPVGPMNSFKGSNPCAPDNTLYYHPVPGSKQHFIQCDQFGVMYLQACDLGQVWSQDIKTCVPDTAGNSDIPGADEQVGEAGPEAGNKGNPCSDSRLAYHAHPGDKHQFIACVAGLPYPMHCPHRTEWIQQITTCATAHSSTD